MEVKVKRVFHDKNDFNIVHGVGEVFSVDNQRAKYLVDHGLAEVVKVEATSKDADGDEPTEDEEKPTVEKKPKKSGLNI